MGKKDRDGKAAAPTAAAVVMVAAVQQQTKTMVTSRMEEKITHVLVLT